MAQPPIVSSLDSTMLVPLAGTPIATMLGGKTIPDSTRGHSVHVWMPTRALITAMPTPTAVACPPCVMRATDGALLLQRNEST
jgi:hypothetical protein